MPIRTLKRCAGMLVLVVTVNAWAQGGGEPVSPQQASAIVAAKERDKQLASDVLAAVVAAGVDGAKIKARSYHGIVTLRGSVATADQIQAASAAAASVPGVTRVKNKLRVPN